MPTPKSLTGSKNQPGPFSLENAIMILSDNFLIVLMVLAAFIGGFFVGSIWTENQLLRNGGVANLGGTTAPAAGQPVAEGEQAEPPIENMPEVSKDEHILGNPDAKVLIVEYSDMNCPFCRRFHPTMKQIVADYGDDVAWVYRHFPFQGQNSTDAAVVSECIAESKGNDAFWKYADSITAKADVAGSLTPQIIVEAAAEVGLTEAQVTACKADTKFQEMVTAKRDGGAAAGVTGTPASIIVTADGPQEFVSGALPIDQLKTTIDAYL